MPHAAYEELFRNIYARSCQIIERHPKTKHVAAADYLLEPETETVIDSATSLFGKTYRVELSRTTELARPHFEWLLEVTLDDKDAESYKHYLLRRDGQVVETYGKQVFPVDLEGVRDLHDVVEQTYSRLLAEQVI